MMRRLLTAVASLKLTLVGMISLLLSVLLAYRGELLSSSWVAVPFAVLALNLLAAIAINPRIRRQRGLLLFHVCLLVLAVLAGISVLMRFEARAEIAEGQRFSSEQAQVVGAGLWHRNRLDEVDFVQGPIEVDYAAANTRRATRSTVYLNENQENGPVVVLGENQSLAMNSYRFVTTSNKGFAVTLSWHDPSGDTLTGAIHLPSYPLYEWKQENAWVTPVGQTVTVRLELPARSSPEREWTLRSPDDGVTLEVRDGAVRRVLAPGDSMSLVGGRLQFEGVRLWMGYRVEYNPWLPWMFMTALLAIAGIGWHFYGRFRLSARHEVAELSNGRWARS